MSDLRVAGIEAVTFDFWNTLVLDGGGAGRDQRLDAIARGDARERADLRVGAARVADAQPARRGLELGGQRRRVRPHRDHAPEPRVPVEAVELRSVMCARVTSAGRPSCVSSCRPRSAATCDDTPA